MAPPTTHLVHVFSAGPDGGNPAPIVLDARGMSDDAMRDVAREHGHESGFVLPPPEGSEADLALRFWVPNHEMEMCGHVTVGAVWLLERDGRLTKDHLRIHTPSGMVEALITHAGTAEVAVEISQPVGHVESLECPDLRFEIPSLLDIEPAALGDGPIQNARTSRVKTLIPIKSIAALDALRPDFSRVATLCERLGSTGLYLYAVGADPGVVDARQFPKASGYPEDAATGIAAAALAFGLREQGLLPSTLPALRVRQGRAMGRPSEISIRFEHTQSEVTGCWIGGAVRAGLASTEKSEARQGLSERAGPLVPEGCAIQS